MGWLEQSFTVYSKVGVWLMNKILLVSVIAVVAISGALILPLVFGNVKLNYEQPTPIFTNTTNMSDRESHFVPASGVQPEHIISLGVRGFDLSGLSHEAQLIVVGKVLDVKQGGQVGVSSTGVPDSLTHTPSINNLVQIEKVIKGQAQGNINVVTEGDLSGKTLVEGAARLHKGEHTVLFLYKEPTYKNQWTILGTEQGKFNVDTKGIVQGKLATSDIKANLGGLEAKLKEVLSKPQIHIKSSDNTKDLTTEQVKQAEEAARQDITNQQNQVENQAEDIKHKIDGLKQRQPKDQDQIQSHDVEPQQLNITS